MWDWRELVAAYLLARAVQDAPLPVPPQERARFSRYVGDVLANPAARSVIVAYTGHNWELFGMWGWMGPFMIASLTARGSSLHAAWVLGGMLAAAVIGVGGTIGAVAGGRLSDRLGRPRAAALMLGASLPCSLAFGWLFNAPLAIVVAVGLVYGTASSPTRRRMRQA